MLLFLTHRLALGIGMAIAVAGMLTACQKKDERTPAATTPPEASTDASAQADTIKAEIDKLRSAYEAAVAAGDASAMSPLLEEGAVLVRPGAPEWEAMAAAAPGLPFPPGAKIAISPIEVVELSKEWAYEFGTATTTYTPQGSQAAIQLHDTYLVLFRNTGKGWKAYREVASSGPPPGAGRWT
jgi:ketosteroid isomerase-like protein